MLLFYLLVILSNTNVQASRKLLNNNYTKYGIGAAAVTFALQNQSLKPQTPQIRLNPAASEMADSQATPNAFHGQVKTAHTFPPSKPYTFTPSDEFIAKMGKTKQVPNSNTKSDPEMIKKAVLTKFVCLEKKDLSPELFEAWKDLKRRIVPNLTCQEAKKQTKVNITSNDLKQIEQFLILEGDLNVKKYEKIIDLQGKIKDASINNRINKKAYQIALQTIKRSIFEMYDGDAAAEKQNILSPADSQFYRDIRRVTPEISDRIIDELVEAIDFIRSDKYTLKVGEIKAFKQAIHEYIQLLQSSRKQFPNLTSKAEEAFDSLLKSWVNTDNIEQSEEASSSISDDVYEYSEEDDDEEEEEEENADEVEEEEEQEEEQIREQEPERLRLEEERLKKEEAERLRFEEEAERLRLQQEKAERLRFQEELLKQQQEQAERLRLEQQEAERLRLEQERLKKEEEAKLLKQKQEQEAERLRIDEDLLKELEEERLKQEEAERLRLEQEAERLRQEQERLKQFKEDLSQKIRKRLENQAVEQNILKQSDSEDDFKSATEGVSESDSEADYESAIEGDFEHDSADDSKDDSDEETLDDTQNETIDGLQDKTLIDSQSDSDVDTQSDSQSDSESDYDDSLFDSDDSESDSDDSLFNYDSESESDSDDSQFDSEDDSQSDSDVDTQSVSEDDYQSASEEQNTTEPGNETVEITKDSHASKPEDDDKSKAGNNSEYDISIPDLDEFLASDDFFDKPFVPNAKALSPNNEIADQDSASKLGNIPNPLPNVTSSKPAHFKYNFLNNVFAIFGTNTEAKEQDKDAGVIPKGIFTDSESQSESEEELTMESEAESESDEEYSIKLESYEDNTVESDLEDPVTELKEKISIESEAEEDSSTESDYEDTPKVSKFEDTLVGPKFEDDTLTESDFEDTLVGPESEEDSFTESDFEDALVGPESQEDHSTKSKSKQDNSNESDSEGGTSVESESEEDSSNESEAEEDISSESDFEDELSESETEELIQEPQKKTKEQAKSSKNTSTEIQQIKGTDKFLTDNEGPNNYKSSSVSKGQPNVKKDIPETTGNKKDIHIKMHILEKKSSKNINMPVNHSASQKVHFNIDKPAVIKTTEASIKTETKIIPVPNHQYDIEPKPIASSNATTTKQQPPIQKNLQVSLYPTWALIAFASVLLILGVIIGVLYYGRKRVDSVV